jgi:Mg-chelatase subunit ChlD
MIPTQPNGTAAQNLFVGVILDRSGSMEAVRDDTIGAYNGMIGDLATQQGTTLLTLTQFDTQSIDLVLDAAPIAAVPRLTAETFVPRGGTPLLDAVGITLTKMQRFVESIGWSGRVLVTVITDGEENSSTEWTRGAVFARVKELESRGWAFSYLGASPNAYHDAQGLGIHAGSTSRWGTKGKNIDALGKSVAAQAGRYRSGLADRTMMIPAEERRAMEDDS